MVGVRTPFIEPGSPWENSYVASFNGMHPSGGLLMFIIFGSKGLERPVKGGVSLTRVCSECNRPTTMDEPQMVVYFTLYFIPLIPVERKECFLKCQECSTAYVLARNDSLSAAPWAREPGARTAGHGGSPDAPDRLRSRPDG